MKRIISILLSVIIALSASSQTKNICSSGIVQGWSPSSNVYTSATSYTSLNEAKEIIRNIIAVMGLKQNFEVLAARIPNAAAVSYRGKRYVLYNPGFINRLNTIAGNKWASVSVLAHEVGHHLNGHTLYNIGSQPGKELEADEFSGFALRRMGATLAEAQVAMKIAASYKSSLTHPGQQQRLIAIAAGWNNANRQMTGQSDMAKVYEKPARQTTAPAASSQEKQATIVRNDEQNVLADRYILRDVHFNGITGSEYFITTRYNLVRVDDNRLYLVGKVIPVQNKNYPYVITDQNDTMLYIDTKGSIITKNGRQVGYMTAHR